MSLPSTSSEPSSISVKVYTLTVDRYNALRELSQYYLQQEEIPAAALKMYVGPRHKLWKKSQDLRDFVM